MKASEALIAWTPTQFSDSPTAGQIQVGPLLGEGDWDWTEPFAYTGGAAYIARRNWAGHKSRAQLFIDFHTVVVRDGIAPATAHQAFLAIAEYAEAISPDIPGARDPKPPRAVIARRPHV